MTSDELKQAIRTKFPTLKKPWFGRDVLELSDKNYKLHPHSAYVECHQAAWEIIENSGVVYHELFPDCDDYVDIAHGLFKLEWLRLIEKGTIPEGSAPIKAVISGYNPQGDNHAYGFIYDNAGMFITDYGNIIPVTGYRPMRFKI